MSSLLAPLNSVDDFTKAKDEGTYIRKRKWTKLLLCGLAFAGTVYVAINMVGSKKF